METLAMDSLCSLTDPQPYQRERAQPPLWERGCAPVENTLIKIDIDAQRQRAVGWSDWLDAFGENHSVRCTTYSTPSGSLMPKQSRWKPYNFRCGFCSPMPVESGL